MALPAAPAPVPAFAPALSLAAAPAAESSPVPAPLSPESFVRQSRSLLAQVARAAYERSGVRPEAAAPSDEDMLKRISELPITNAEREKYIVELFKLGGATEGQITVQAAGRGSSNVIVTKQGRTDRRIVIGGHFDLAGRGSRGTIDNGTGVTMVANLFQALQDVPTDATLVFIAFAREEEGLIGSRRYVDSLSAEERAKIDAMINLDTLAVDGTFSWQNNSTRPLLDRFAEVSRESGRALDERRLNGGDSDSSSFRRAGIPAMTLYGASEGVIFDVVHGPNDNMRAFKLEHYKNAYFLTLAVAKSLDGRPLGRVADHLL